MEPLRGYLTLAEQLFEQGPSFGEGWNFGPNDEDAKPVDWHPALRLKDALALIIDWSKQREAGANMRQLTLAQLQAYQVLTN